MRQGYQEGTRQSILLRLAVILAALLVVLASLALLYIFIQVLQRCGNVLVLFTLGAIVAYVLNPGVNRATALLGRRWAGMLAVYAAVAAALAILMVLLFQPLLTQTSSLVTSLNSPSRASLRTLADISNQVMTSKTVGIHPLEAMAAALVGYPLAGLLGSFFAVPAVALAHVLAREAYASWKARTSPPKTGTGDVRVTPDQAETHSSGGTITPTPVHATRRSE
jgi:predicted PurR-regulated permease PerM